MMTSNATEVSAEWLAYLPVHRQLELFRRKRFSPVDVLEAQIARIERGSQSINAVTCRHFEGARSAAKKSEARYHRGEARTLEGITVAVKEEYEKSGWRATAGSMLFKDRIAKDTHPVIDKLLEAGAILHIQTTAPEFFLLGVTWSDLWGVTRNPWNPEFTPGGSSGGSAAALAAGMASLALGSDMGGSIRIPAALNGLFGSKPAYGRIASPDPSALVPHASPGPLARDCRDMILLQNVMCGPAPGCPAVLEPKLELPLEPKIGQRWKIALCVDQGWAQIDPDIRANTLAAVERFEAAGAVVDEVVLDFETSDSRLRETIEKALFSTAIGAELIELAEKKDRLTTYGRRFVELASTMGPLDAKGAAEEALRVYELMDKKVFRAGYDAIVTPTVATTRIPADYDPTTDRPVIEGKAVDPYSGWFLTSLFSLVNWMPVINVPTGAASNNIPTGLQIATRPYGDSTAAAIALAYADQMDLLPFQRVTFQVS
jgi:Asp-tRNA(Asn)/Glu-tRNA(Gln) amidotransferase A subunit family amidase